MNRRRFRLTIDSNVEDAVVAATMVRGLLDQLRVAPQDADAIELCLTEALVNAVRHAYKGISGNAFHLDLELEPAAISFEVCTPGRSTSRQRLLQAIDAALSFDPVESGEIPESGRGMLIISQTMDTWDYFTRGADGVLSMRKTLRSQIHAG